MSLCKMQHELSLHAVYICLLVSLSSGTIYTTSYKTCNGYCYAGDIVDCIDGNECNLICNYGDDRRRNLLFNGGGCNNLIINCPKDSVCNINCNYRCDGLTVYAQNSSLLSITRCDNCDDIELHCPMTQSLNGPDSHCKLQIEADIYRLIVYAQESVFDFQLIQDLSTDELLDNPVIHCGPTATEHQCILAADGTDCIPTSTSPCKGGLRLTTLQPTLVPTQNPTSYPTKYPTPSPTNNPTPSPTNNPTLSPSNNPTPAPTNNPSPAPTNNPTSSPTNNPIPSPTRNPTKSPTSDPIDSHTSDPTGNPTLTPSPTNNPTVTPTNITTPSSNTNPSFVPTTNPIITDTNIMMISSTKIKNVSDNVNVSENSDFLKKINIILVLLIIICCLSITVCFVNTRYKRAIKEYKENVSNIALRTNIEIHSKPETNTNTDQVPSQKHININPDDTMPRIQNLAEQKSKSLKDDNLASIQMTDIMQSNNNYILGDISPTNDETIERLYDVHINEDYDHQTAETPQFPNNTPSNNNHTTNTYTDCGTV